MSPELINLNSDLQQLLNEGYEVEFLNSYLIIHHVPYVNDKKQIEFGTLVSKSIASGNIVKPADHTSLWVGNFPCDSTGSQLLKLGDNPIQEQIKGGLIATRMFSQKPKTESAAYADFYEKMTTYVRILENEAHVIDSTVTAKTFRPVETSENESVFRYFDTASSRAGITSINDKLKKDKIAIVGLGGTGSYILDLIAKTPVNEIHLFDDDNFYNHNAFRSPGAPSIDDLLKNLTKVEWFAENYSRMRRNIIPHSQRVNEANVTELNSMDFVFLCLDKGESRKIIMDDLIENKISFIDVGIGLINENEALTGLVRTTTSTSSFNNDISNIVPFSDDDDNEYSTNIQVADINALNAALAVIKWKKLCGFYHDIPNEHHTVFGISTNTLTNNEVENET